MNTRNISACAAILACALCSPATATTLLQNGGFEAGLAGWTRVDQLGSEGTFFLQNGALSPLNGFPVPAPPEGSRAAMTDAGAGGSHVLYQDFLVPVSVMSANVMFSLFLANYADQYYTPDHLDWARTATPPPSPTGIILNQRARVDIVRTTADPFSLNPADILLNLFETQPADPLMSGYNNYQFDVTALLQANAGQTLRLRFSEVDNVAPFNFGVDNVSVNSPAAVPEPGTWALTAGAFAAFAVLRRRSLASRRRG